jgi:putative DNA primase/helicase
MPRDDLTKLKGDLWANAASLVEALLGSPNRRVSTRRTLRWGRRGSLALELGGPKRGQWFSHEAGIGGDLLGLVQHVRGCSFPEALTWARDWLGMPELERRKAAPRSWPEPIPEEGDEARQEVARQFWAAAIPIPGTVAELYLKQTRGIPCPAGGWPNGAVRFHVGKRALIVAATTPAGEVRAVQLVYLDDQGRKAAIPVPKRSFGRLEGAAVRLPSAVPGKLSTLVAEGAETGLAAWAATGHPVLIALGSVKKLSLPSGDQIVVLADDDPRHSQADNTRRRTLSRWWREGRDVVPVFPWRVRRHDRSDFADLIAAEGADAVRARIKAALDPGKPIVRRPLPIAEQMLARTVREFVEGAEAGDDTPPVHAVRVDLGVGKTRVACEVLAKMVARMRATGDMRAVAYVVPFHELAGDVENTLRRLAPEMTVRTWRGRSASAPNQTGLMCRQPERVAEVRRLHLDVQEYACRGCPSAAGCEYLAQHKSTADIWIVPAALLQQRPPAALGKLAALVVDEPALPSVESTQLPLLDLERYDAIKDDRLASQRLDSLRHLTLDALATSEEGPLTPQVFRRMGMTSESAAELLALEWRTLIEPKPAAGAAAADRVAALREAARNADLGPRTLLARALVALLAPDGPDASGVAVLRIREDGKRVLHLLAHRPVRDGWRVPTLLLDGTMRLEVVRQTWPSAELVADIAVDAPHMRVSQVADGSFTLSALNADEPGLKEAERKRRERNLDRLQVRLHTEARRHAGKRVLVVCNKCVRHRLEALRMPPLVELAHFNALRGLDRWRDVAAVIVVGWVLPPAAAMEQLAGALTGAAVPPTGYQRAEAVRELADGTMMPAETWQHAEPLVEALRWSTCEAESLQAIGRGRGVRRTAAGPLEVLVLGEAVLSLPVKLVPLTAPSLADVQLAHGGIAYAAAAHAFRAYGKALYPSAEAAKRTFARWREAALQLGTNPYDESSIGECLQLPPGTTRVRYQLAGPRQRPVEALVDLAACPDPRAEIEAKQGALAAFDLVEARPPKDTLPGRVDKEQVEPAEPDLRPASLPWTGLPAFFGQPTQEYLPGPLPSQAASLPTLRRRCGHPITLGPKAC